jgi:hypothetical protein
MGRALCYIQHPDPSTTSPHLHTVPASQVALGNTALTQLKRLQLAPLPPHWSNRLSTLAPRGAAGGAGVLAQLVLLQAVQLQVVSVGDE